MRQLIHDEQGQDLIEYALLAGFMAVAISAIMPGISASINSVFTKVTSTLRASIESQ